MLHIIFININPLHIASQGQFKNILFYRHLFILNVTIFTTSIFNQTRKRCECTTSYLRAQKHSAKVF